MDEIIFDFMKDTPKQLWAKQYDTMRWFLFTLQSNGAELDTQMKDWVENCDECCVNAYRPYTDESHSYNGIDTVSETDPRTGFGLDDWVTSVPGTVYISLSYMKDNGLLTTGKVVLNVEKSEFEVTEPDGGEG